MINMVDVKSETLGITPKLTYMTKTCDWGFKDFEIGKFLILTKPS